MVFAIYWHESAMDLHVFLIPIPPPTSLPIPSLWIFSVHQPWALVSCIQPGLVICFTLDKIHVSMLISHNIPPSPSPTESKSLYSKRDTDVQSYGFFSNHMWIWELDHKEGWALKNWCLWIMVLDKTLANPLDRKEIKPINPKGKTLWIFTGWTVEAKALILWPPDAKRPLNGKDFDAGKEWRQKEVGAAEDEMIGWHRQLNGQEFGQITGDTEGQGAWHAAVHGAAKS